MALNPTGPELIRFETEMVNVIELNKALEQFTGAVRNRLVRRAMRKASMPVFSCLMIIRTRILRGIHKRLCTSNEYFERCGATFALARVDSNSAQRRHIHARCAVAFNRYRRARRNVIRLNDIAVLASRHGELHVTTPR